MNTLIQKYFPLISIIFLAAFIISFFFAPSIAAWVGIAYLLLNLSIAISSIFAKHRQSENPQPKIIKDVLILVLTLILIIFLGELAGLFANSYASPRFGIVAGILSAIVASLAVGYSVRRALEKVLG